VVRLVQAVIMDVWFVLFLLFCVVFAFALALHLLYRETEAAGAAFASLDVSTLSVFTWIFYAFDQVCHVLTARVYVARPSCRAT
jgi:hypothetical protein